MKGKVIDSVGRPVENARVIPSFVTIIPASGLLTPKTDSMVAFSMTFRSKTILLRPSYSSIK